MKKDQIEETIIWFSYPEYKPRPLSKIWVKYNEQEIGDHYYSSEKYFDWYWEYNNEENIYWSYGPKLSNKYLKKCDCCFESKHEMYIFENEKIQQVREICSDCYPSIKSRMEEIGWKVLQ